MADPWLDRFGIGERVNQLLRPREIEIDPSTLSEGLVLARLGPGRDKWGRKVNLVEVKVIKSKAHHKEGDRVIWEIPPDEELKVFAGRVLSRADALRRWHSSAGPRTSPDAETLRRMRSEEIVDHLLKETNGDRN